MDAGLNNLLDAGNLHVVVLSGHFAGLDYVFIDGVKLLELLMTCVVLQSREDCEMNP